MNERVVVPPSGRLIRRLLVAAFAAVGLVSVLPGVAFAENSVASSTPADGSTIAESPAEIQITFTEAVGEANTITVTCNTELFTVGPRRVSDDNLTLNAEVIDPLPKGTCVAAWAVSDPDGAPNGQGNVTFTVENGPEVVETTPTTPGSTPTGTTGTTTGATDTTDPSADTATTDEVAELESVDTGQGPLWLGRLLSVLGVAVLFGSLVLIAAAWPEGVEYLLAVRFIRTAWIVAFVGTLLYVAAATAAVTGSGLGSGFNPTNWPDLFDAGIPGIAAIARLVLVAASGFVAFRPDRVIDPVTQMVSLGIPALAVATIGLSRTEHGSPDPRHSTRDHPCRRDVGVARRRRAPRPSRARRPWRGGSRARRPGLQSAVQRGDRCHRGDRCGADGAARRWRSVRFAARTGGAAEDRRRRGDDLRGGVGTTVRQSAPRSSGRTLDPDGRPSASGLRRRGTGRPGRSSP